MVRNSSVTMVATFVVVVVALNFGSAEILGTDYIAEMLGDYLSFVALAVSASGVIVGSDWLSRL